MTVTEFAHLHRLAKEWETIASLYEENGKETYGVEAVRLAERAEVYGECAQELRRSLGIAGREVQPDEDGHWQMRGTQDEDAQD